MNIPLFLQKCKAVVKSDVYIVLVIVFIGFAGFGLGRLSILEENKTPVRVFYNEKDQIASVTNTQTEGTLVASKSGSKYHYPWCSGAQRIKESNKVWFSSKEDAERAGYTPALNCKGL